MFELEKYREISKLYIKYAFKYYFNYSLNDILKDMINDNIEEIKIIEYRDVAINFYNYIKNNYNYKIDLKTYDVTDFKLKKSFFINNLDDIYNEFIKIYYKEYIHNEDLNSYNNYNIANYINYRIALYSLGGDEHWNLFEQTDWIIKEYGESVLNALKIASRYEG